VGSEQAGRRGRRIFATVPHQHFRHTRIRDLRKAIRKGTPARDFARLIATKAGEVSAELMTGSPEIIMVGGGLVEDMRDEALGIVERVAFGHAADSGEATVRFLPSMLGNSPD
jgi:hypothetical protein